MDGFRPTFGASLSTAAAPPDSHPALHAPPIMPRARIGLWLLGAKGGVATTALTGLIALKKGLIEPVGLVSALPQFAGLDLLDWKDLVVGGHDIRPGRLFDEANRMNVESRAIRPTFSSSARASWSASNAISAPAQFSMSARRLRSSRPPTCVAP